MSKKEEKILQKWQEEYDRLTSIFGVTIENNSWAISRRALEIALGIKSESLYGED